MFFPQDFMWVITGMSTTDRIFWDEFQWSFCTGVCRSDNQVYWILHTK